MSDKKLLDGTELGVMCPECAPMVKLVVRTNRASGHQFLGCPNWPECNHTQPIPEDVKMRMEGAVPLPGFE